MTEHNRDGDSWWEERKIGQKVLMGIGFGILGVGFLFLVGLVTMLLWNVLMPQIFGLTTITYCPSSFSRTGATVRRAAARNASANGIFVST
jgi:hypothetical protein